MKCLIMAFFKDEAGEWHQPGNVENFGRGDAEGYAKRGCVKILETAMVEQPETRVVKFSRRRK